MDKENIEFHAALNNILHTLNNCFDNKDEMRITVVIRNVNDPEQFFIQGNDNEGELIAFLAEKTLLAPHLAKPNTEAPETLRSEE